MEANLVGNMGKISTLRPNTASHGNCVVHQLMAMVRPVKAQGVDDQGLYTPQVTIFVFLHGLHVRDVGKRAETIAHNGQLIVHYTDRQHGDIAYQKLPVGEYGMEI